MKSIKPLIVATFAAASLMVSGPSVQAQGDTNASPPPPSPGGPPIRSEGGPGPGMANRQDFDTIARQLNLTDDQKAKFKSIMDSRAQKMRDLRKDPGFASQSPQDRRAKVKAIQDEMRTQMKSLLTPAQFDQWQKMPFMNARGGGPINPPPRSPNAGDTNAPAPRSANPP